MPSGPNRFQKSLLLIGGVALCLLYPLMILVAYLSGKGIFDLSGKGINASHIYIVSMCLCAALIWYGVLQQFRYEEPYSRIVFIGRCILGVGCVAFLGGYIGPLILTPESNLGPLFGIFLTGPIGAVLGGFIGITYLAIYGKSNNTTEQKIHAPTDGPS